MDLNKVMLIGRVTQAPQSRTTPQGVTVTNFSIATNRVWKDQQGQQQKAGEFHNIVAWRRLGEICAQYLSKGSQIYIEGHLQTRNWMDPQSNQKRYRTEIIADNMIMLGSKNDTMGQPQSTGMNMTSSEPTQQMTADNDMESSMASTPIISDEEIRIEDIPF